MANPLDKIKGMNYKELALEHGEKAGLGLIGLIALLMILAGRWKTESRTPEELKTQVTSADAKLDQTTWPDAKKETYSSGYNEATAKYALKYDMRKKTFDQIHATSHNLRVADGREYSTRMSWPLYQQQQKVKEPVYLPVMEPIATYDRVIIEVAETSALGDDPLAADGPEAGGTEEEEKKTGGFRRRDKNRPGLPGSGVGSNGLPSAGGYVPDYSAPGADEGQDNDALDPNYTPDYSAQGTTGGTTDPEDFYSGVSSNVNGRGERMIAIRAVFPMKDQLKMFAQALGIEVDALNPSELREVEIMNFRLQRQTAVAGENPWSGEWKDVDLEAAKNVLKQSADFDVDELDSGVIDPVISMPLPRRSMKYWEELATHPRLRNFKLSPEELEKKNKLEAEILRLHQERQGVAPVKKGGFANLQYDTNTARQDLLGGADSSKYYAELANAIGGTGPEGGEATAETSKTLSTLKARVGQAAVGHLILFRYFDFNVLPGNVYRYRIQLELRNPFYGEKREHLTHPDIAENQTEKTEWSLPTAPVVVPEDTLYLLTKVEEPRSAAQNPAAKLNVYYHHPEIGTPMKKELTVAEGQFIGEKTRADVLNPAKETWKEEEVEITTTDLLLDIKEEPDLDPADHPGLKVNTKKVGARNPNEGLIDQALVVDEYGQLTDLDPITKMPQAKFRDNILSEIEKEFGEWKDRGETEDTGDALEGYGPDGPNYSANGLPSTSTKKKKKSRNANRRRPTTVDCN